MNALSLPLLHARGAFPNGWLHSNWRFEPTVIVGVIVLAAFYVIWTGSKNRDAAGQLVNPVTAGQRIAFMSGLVVLLIALGQPLDDWSDYYLLSAHMFQHMLLMFAVIPLLLHGTPDWLIAKVLSPQPLRQVWIAITRPIPAALISTAILIVWHFPFAYDGAIRHEPIHVVEHLLFLLAATISWWPVMGPLLPGQTRMAPLLQCLYLFALSLPSGILGAFITLSDPSVYASYVGVPEIWGIGRETDHEVAGLMMWVLAGMVYLVVITGIFFSWSAREQAKENAPQPRQPQPPSAPIQGASRP